MWEESEENFRKDPSPHPRKSELCLQQDIRQLSMR